MPSVDNQEDSQRTKVLSPGKEVGQIRQPVLPRRLGRVPPGPWRRASKDTLALRSQARCVPQRLRIGLSAVAEQLVLQGPGYCDSNMYPERET